MPHLLIVDDEKNIREGLYKALSPHGYTISLAADGKEGFWYCLTKQVDLAILDIKMPKISGFEMLKKINELDQSIPVVFLTGQGNVEMAVEAMQQGAYDFLTKPVNLNKLEMVIHRALNLQQLQITNRALTVKVKEYEIEKTILGTSRVTKKLIQTIKQVAPSKANIYIYGESGTGKEDICNAIHGLSLQDKPLIKVNCAALPPTLIESELFGHEKGAFTGADQRKIGRFEAANGGTLFLDEVSEIPLNIQVKLLRVLQEKSIERIGSHHPIPIDCRLISASNKDLQQEIKQERFRNDLFYRLNVIDIHVSPLRERPEDVEVISRHFFDFFAKQNNRPDLEVMPSVYANLRQYSWPGNVRELRNVIEKITIMSKEDPIRPKHLPPHIDTRSKNISEAIVIPYEMSLAEATQKIIYENIKYYEGNKTLAAKNLQVGRKTLQRKLQPK